MRIRATCIDDKNKPSIIPASKWVVKGNQYHITWIYKMVNQNGIQGVSLAEHDISDCKPYNCYRLTRFAIHEEDIPALIELMRTCTELSDVDINKLIEELETVEA